MRINFSAWAIRNPVPPILLFVVLCLLGILSFMSLPVTKFPNIDIPVVAVSVTQGGATPAELETQVTREIEDSVANVTGVKHIVSTVTDGSSVTAVEFQLEVNTDRALLDVKDAVDKIRANLPRDVDEPIVSRIDVEGQSILSFATSSPGMTLEQISWHVDDVVKRRLMGLKGVGKVERYGGVKREIRVELDPDRLLAYGVTSAEVNRQVRATNTDLGSGRGEVGGQEQAIRVLAGARNVEALADTKINLTNGRQVRLSDLGRVLDDSSEQRSFGRLNGQPVVAFAIFRAKGASEMTVRDGVEAKLAELAQGIPRHPHDQDRRRGRLHRRQLPQRLGNADRGLHSRRHRRLPVPAQHPRDVDLGDRPAARRHSRVLVHQPLWFLAQSRQPARHHARHRHSRRRRHRRDREHRAPP